jgi:hypothetical protein
MTGFIYAMRGAACPNDFLGTKPKPRAVTP